MSHKTTSYSFVESENEGTQENAGTPAMQSDTERIWVRGAGWMEVAADMIVGSDGHRAWSETRGWFCFTAESFPPDQLKTQRKKAAAKAAVNGNSPRPQEPQKKKHKGPDGNGDDDGEDDAEEDDNAVNSAVDATENVRSKGKDASTNKSKSGHERWNTNIFCSLCEIYASKEIGCGVDANLKDNFLGNCYVHKCRKCERWPHFVALCHT